jgi:hypothetical protein
MVRHGIQQCNTARHGATWRTTVQTHTTNSRWNRVSKWSRKCRCLCQGHRRRSPTFQYHTACMHACMHACIHTCVQNQKGNRMCRCSYQWDEATDIPKVMRQGWRHGGAGGCTQQADSFELSYWHTLFYANCNSTHPHPVYVHTHLPCLQCC